MGDKIASKELAIKAGVPVIPGHAEALKDEDGGPGRGGRHRLPGVAQTRGRRGRQGHAHRPEPRTKWKAALAASRQETRKAFDDSRIFMERYIEQPRHVEIQILADTLGNVVHLGERECSIQRRYQKIIEESPSPAVSEDAAAAHGPGRLRSGPQGRLCQCRYGGIRAGRPGRIFIFLK